MSFVVLGNFFCRFKIGDNIIYNLSVLEKLYEYSPNTRRGRELIVKPQILIIASILEAILHDFHLRIRANVHEGIPGLVDEILIYIRNKQIDQFETYIQSIKKHNLLKLTDTSFYDELDDLRKIRNRIHIQNLRGDLPENESELFDLTAKVKAEKCLEQVVKNISKEYARPGNLANQVGELKFPWDEHFP